MNSYKVVGNASRERKCRSLQVIGMAPIRAAFIFGALSAPLFGETAPGLAGGIASDSGGKPVTDAQVIAYNLESGMNRVTVTGADGAFKFASLEPGKYVIAATKNGFQKASAHVEVSARQTAQVDLTLQVAADLRRPAEKADIPPLTERERQLLDRIERLEGRLAAMEAKEASPPLAYTRPTSETETLVASLNP